MREIFKRKILTATGMVVLVPFEDLLYPKKIVLKTSKHTKSNFYLSFKLIFKFFSNKLWPFSFIMKI